jgi:hypothetical protein
LCYAAAELSHFSAVDTKMCSPQFPGHKIVSALYLNGGVILPMVFINITIQLVLLKQHNHASWHIVI